MTEEEINEYVNMDEPYDKAGAYAIQGYFQKYIEKYEGCLLYTSLEAVTVGNTPPSVDDLLVGSTQRTRTGPIKSLVVLGMNEGLIPKQNEQESLITCLLYTSY